MNKQLIDITPIKDLIKDKIIETYEHTNYSNSNRISVNIDTTSIVDAYIESKELTQPEVYITTTAYTKMRMLVDKQNKEVGWYGLVEQLPPNKYIITDIIVYPQKVTGATVEQDDDRMFDFEMSLTTEQVNTKRFHGHSHVNMSTGPSGVDEAFYADLLTQVQDYFIITVTNKRNEYTTRFYDIANNILYTDVPITVIDEAGNDLELWYSANDELITDRVAITPTVKSSYEPSSSISSYYDYEDDDEAYWDSVFNSVHSAKFLASGYNKKKRGRPKKNV